MNEAGLQAMTSVDVDGWLEAVLQIPYHSATCDLLPSELTTALNALESSLCCLSTAV